MWRWPARILKNDFRINENCLRKFSGCHRKWNVLFFGTDDFSLTSLQEIHRDRVGRGVVDRLEVVTSRGLKENRVAEFARKHELRVHEWPVPDASTMGNGFHLGVVVSFGHLIPSRLIQSFPMGMMNVHASLLPRWRGAAPIVHCLLNGDTATGATVMRIRPRHFDIGEIISQRSIDISDTIVHPQLYSILSTLGSKMLLECLYELPACLDKAVPQDESKVTLAPKITKSISAIDWSAKSAAEVYNLSRALFDVYPLLTKFGNRTVYLKEIRVCKNAVSNDTSAKPGKFEYDRDLKAIRVRCADGRYVYFNKVKLKGRAEMSASDFKNGFLKDVPEQLRYFERFVIS